MCCLSLRCKRTRQILPHSPQITPPPFLRAHTHTHLPVFAHSIHAHANCATHGRYFNGDPHPGNILLHPDGRLGLIDYGQVKKLPAEKRLKLARLYKAIWERDSEAIIAGQLDMELKTQKMDPYVIEKVRDLSKGREDGAPCLPHPGRQWLWRQGCRRLAPQSSIFLIATARTTPVTYAPSARTLSLRSH